MQGTGIPTTADKLVRADIEGRVSAPTGKVSIGGKSSSVAVREQNSLNIQDALADEW